MLRANPCPNLRRLMVLKRATRTGYACSPCLFAVSLSRETALKAVRDSSLPLLLSPCRNESGRYHPIYLPSAEEDEEAA
jgi:hypothetical protein